MTAATDRTLASYSEPLTRALARLPRSMPERAELEELAVRLSATTARETMTTTDVARELGVHSPTTVKNWLEGGLFPGAYQTAGGHWRFLREEVMRVRQEMAETRENNASSKYRLKKAGPYDPRRESSY